MSVHAEAYRLGAQQKPAELERLSAVLEGIKPIRRVLEVGSYSGGMLWWIRQHLEPELIVSVDFAPQPRADVSIVGDSHSIFTLEQAAEHAPYDLVFIDGDHSYAGVRDDWADYGPLAATPGAICFHDIVPHPPEIDCHVDKLWAEIKTSFWKTVEIVEPGPFEGGGIGVLFQS